MFILPMNAPGVKMFCASPTRNANTTGQPFDYPLSSRFDENDAILVLDNVFVPWKMYLVQRDAAKILSFPPGLRLHAWLLLSGLHPACREARFYCWPVAKALRATAAMLSVAIRPCWAR